MNALCFSACLSFSLLAFAVAGVSAEDVPPVNDQPPASTPKTQPEPVSPPEADPRVEKLVKLDDIPESTDDVEYGKLRERRRRITEKIDFYDAKRRYLVDNVYYLESEIFELEKRKQDLQNDPSGKDIAKAIIELDKRINTREGQKAKIDSDIDKNETQLEKLNDAVPAIDTRLSTLLSFEARQDNFRWWISLTYAIMVAAVIAGFFFVIWKSGKAGELFSNQQGLQFITLFSLVIAIILFGVLRILEAKELSALLGAISGYVLGRVSAGEVQSAISKAAPPPAGAVGGGGTGAPATAKATPPVAGAAGTGADGRATTPGTQG